MDEDIAFILPKQIIHLFSVTNNSCPHRLPALIYPQAELHKTPFLVYAILVNTFFLVPTAERRQSISPPCIAHYRDPGVFPKCSRPGRAGILPINSTSVHQFEAEKE